MDELNELLKRIVINPEVMVGKPIIKGTRITVEHVMWELSSGMAPADILDAHPHLSLDDVRAACAYAAARLKDERILIDAE